MTSFETEVPIGEKRLSILVNMPRKSNDWVVFLFGGSRTRGKERFTEWQKTLAQENINSVSFDYSGTGKSTGNFFASSLANRINETAAIIRWLKKNFGSKIQFTVCGGSMGAYIALGVCRIFPKSIKNLILFCPAAYAKESHSVCFGPEFTACIRKPNSWKNSLSFEGIQQFTGRVLLLVPENDKIIPLQIPFEYRQRAKNASCVKYVTIYQTTHNLLDPQNTSRRIRHQIYQHSVEFIKEKS